MSDWATMKQDILRTLHLDATTTGSVVDDDMSRAIIESILFNRGNNLGWNQAYHVFTTDIGQFDYALPADYLSLSGSVFYSVPTTSDVTVYGKRPLKSSTMDWIRENRYRTNEFGVYVDVGLPGYYGIDPSTRRMHLSPSPSEVAQVEYIYSRDPGTPTFKYTGSAYEYYVPNSSDILPSTYTNDWFDVSKGYYLILNRAIFIMCSRTYAGTEEMGEHGAVALRLWAEELNRLRGEANRIVSIDTIRRRM